MGLRVECDLRNEKLGKKIREAQLDKVPYLLIVGDKEMEEGVVAVRHRSEGDLGKMDIKQFAERALMEVATKKIN